MRDKNTLHLRREMVLNHDCIVEKQILERQKSYNLKVSKMEDNHVKHEEKVTVNRGAVFKGLNATKEKGYLDKYSCFSGEANIEHCNLEEFGGLVLKDLKAFIVAHDDTLTELE